MGTDIQNGMWKLGRINREVFVLFLFYVLNLLICALIVQLGIVLVFPMALRIRASNSCCDMQGAGKGKRLFWFLFIYAIGCWKQYCTQLL